MSVCIVNDGILLVKLKKVHVNKLIKLYVPACRGPALSSLVAK